MDRTNNFDLIRWLAATQVVIWHCVEHFHLPVHGWALVLLRAFPGVPIFFVVSGYLIYASYERNRDEPLRFYVNRLLRIYPALWACFAFTVLVLAATGTIGLSSLTDPSFWAWVVAQITVFQFWTPHLLRSFGLGTPNGALWTIVVELQFYAIIPLVYWSIDRLGKNGWAALVALAAVSIGCYAVVLGWPLESMARKLAKVSVLPYLWNFLVGVALFQYWKTVRPFIVGKGVWWLTIYLAYAMVLYGALDLYQPVYFPNALGLIGATLLSVTTIAVAYTAPGVAKGLLRDVDISYGTYVFHSVVLNLLIHLGVGGWTATAITLAAAWSLGWLSWFLVEKPSLSAKRVLHARIRSRVGSLRD